MRVDELVDVNTRDDNNGAMLNTDIAVFENNQFIASATYIGLVGNPRVWLQDLSEPR